MSKHHHQPSQPAVALKSASAAEGQPAVFRWRVEIPMCLVAPDIVEAANEADALACYMAANGILGTSQLPVVKKINE